MYLAKESHPEEYSFQINDIVTFFGKQAYIPKPAPLVSDPNIPSPTVLPSSKSMCFVLFMHYLFS
jgi:hypothetical protein